jgi:hypothetical protein
MCEIDRISRIIGVQEGDIFAPCSANTQIASCRRPPTLLLQKGASATEGIPDVLSRAVRRTIVDNNDFEVAVRLRQDRVQSISDETSGAVHGNYGAD